MVSISRYDSTGSMWQPFAAAAIATSSCSDVSGSISRSLSHARSSCIVDDAAGSALLQREPSIPLISRAGPSKLPKHPRIPVEISSQPSQEFLYAHDMATPIELFPIESLSNMDSANRSPPPSPMRHPPKRHRHINAPDADSDCASQEGLSQGQSDINSFREEGSAGLDRGPKTSRPPIPKSKQGKSEPPKSARKHPPSSPAGSRHHQHPASLITHFAGLTLPPAAALQASSHRQSRLNREYIVEEEMGKEVGHGTYGVVFHAVHRQCGKAYAIKKTKKPALSHADVAKWMQEVRALALVEGHPHVICYYDSWTEVGQTGGDHQHIKLELCGKSLRFNVNSKQALNTNDLWVVMQQMASALQHVHGLGLAHLDVKPDNIYRSLAEPDQLKLGDFGLATDKDGSKGVSEGDARYLAPELLKGGLQLDKADMFALGATVYELATASTLPAEGERWVALREGRLMMLPAVSQQLQSLIKRLLSSDPNVRPDAAAVVAICQKAMTPKEHLPASRFGSQPSSQVSF